MQHENRHEVALRAALGDYLDREVAQVDRMTGPVEVVTLGSDAVEVADAAPGGRAAIAVSDGR